MPDQHFQPLPEESSKPVSRPTTGHCEYRMLWRRRHTRLPSTRFSRFYWARTGGFTRTRSSSRRRVSYTEFFLETATALTDKSICRPQELSVDSRRLLCALGIVRGARAAPIRRLHLVQKVVGLLIQFPIEQQPSGLDSYGERKSYKHLRRLS